MSRGYRHRGQELPRLCPALGFVQPRCGECDEMAFTPRVTGQFQHLLAGRYGSLVLPGTPAILAAPHAVSGQGTGVDHLRSVRAQ